MSEEPQPITPDPNAPPMHRQRGFWRRDVLIWGVVLLVLACLAAWRLSTTGRGPENADALYPAEVGLRRPGDPPPPPGPGEVRPTLPAPPEPTGNP